MSCKCVIPYLHRLYLVWLVRKSYWPEFNFTILNSQQTAHGISNIPETAFSILSHCTIDRSGVFVLLERWAKPQINIQRWESYVWWVINAAFYDGQICLVAGWGCWGLGSVVQWAHFHLTIMALGWARWVEGEGDGQAMGAPYISVLGELVKSYCYMFI